MAKIIYRVAVKLKKIFALILTGILCAGCSTVPTQQTNSGGYYDIDNKGSGWGLKKEQGQEPYIPDGIKQTLDVYKRQAVRSAAALSVSITAISSALSAHIMPGNVLR